MWEFGGFFQWEKYDKKEYHENAVKLNSARHCFRFLLEIRKYNMIYFPYYICDSIVEQAKKLNINYKFYKINKNFEPILDENVILGEDTGIFIVNFFGFLSEKKILKFKSEYKNIILDNTQSFYSKRIKNVDTIYSCRKFFPVVEGGYLYINLNINNRLKKLTENIIHSKLDFLFKKFELGSNEAYKNYLNVEESIDYEEIKKMSKLTINFMKRFDYEKIKLKRERNFLYLDKMLSKINLLNLKDYNINGPMFYPLLLENNIKKRLLKNKIYLSTLWIEVKDRVEKNSFEYQLVEKLHLIPIDDRWEIKDLDNVIKKILNYYR